MSISEKQLEANRANAQKSTGPTSATGRQRAALNGTRHGLTGATFLMTDADRSAFNSFAKPFIEALKPANEAERHYAQLLARDHYRLARIQAIEENTFALGHFGKAAHIDVDHQDIHTALTQARTFQLDGKVFQNLSLYEQRINRNMDKNMKALHDLQDRRRKEERDSAFEAEKAAAKPKTHAAGAGSQPSENTDTRRENGFGFSSLPIGRHSDPSSPENTLLHFPAQPVDPTEDAVGPANPPAEAA